ncbi:hypothetical protein ACFYNL_16500 [Streptomyces sp. NPDC007808]|uniref:hypothetical protein n=1 Tax=Streptomyces sp. NPDC007808 TaxID=3364779 RepID=UPI0036B1B969
MQTPRDNAPIPSGPVETMPHGCLGTAEQRAALLAELERAGVELGTYDRGIVDWLATFDYSVVATLASLIRRAAHHPH